MRVCYVCYEKVDSKGHYHSACSKKLFQSETPPKLDFSENDIEKLATEYVKNRMGIPGVQRKLSLGLLKNKSEPIPVLRLTIIGYLGGEYILKPPSQDYPNMPELEDLTMHLAEIARITVATHGLIPINNQLAYITKRFDRKAKLKIAVEDLCQLSEKTTENKYKSSSEKVGEIIKRYSSFPGEDCLKYFELILFSYIVGNADMHLKNFSLITEDTNNIRLSPCYDLLSTKLLLPEHIDPEELALSVNGKKKNIRTKDFVLFGNSLGIPEKVIRKTIQSMQDHYNDWLKKIDNSFINDEMKVQLKDYIAKKIEII